MPDKPPRRPFGPARREVATIGQGTWRAEETGKEAAIAALRRGLDLGLTHIDTAEMYGSGDAEKIVAAAIRGGATRCSWCRRFCRSTPRRAVR